MYIAGSNPEGGLEETLEEASRLVRPLVQHVPNVLVTLGQYGAMLVTQVRPGIIRNLSLVGYRLRTA